MKNEHEGVEMLRKSVYRVAASLPAARRRPAGAEPWPIDFPKPPRRTRLRLAVAAGVVLAVLGYPAYRGLVLLPRLEAENADLRSALSASSGEAAGAPAAAPVDLHVISLPRRPSALRSAPEIERPPAIAVRRQEPLVLLVEVDPEWIGPGGSEEGYLLELLDAGGGSAGSWILGDDELRELVDAHQAVPLLLPAGTLAAGSYDLRFSRRPAGAGEVLSSTRLEIVWAP